MDGEHIALQTEGVGCRKDIGVVDELPGTYKDMDEVIEPAGLGRDRGDVEAARLREGLTARDAGGTFSRGM